MRVLITFPFSRTPDVSADDDRTVRALRTALGEADRYVLPTRDLAAKLRNIGRPLWALMLDEFEDGRYATVEFSSQ